MNTRQTFVVVPVRNRCAMTMECFRCLSSQVGVGLQSIMVDDGSTDGVRDRVAQQFPDVRIVVGDGSLWWTGATNAGVELALSQAGDDDFILTLNNDTLVGPEYVAQLLDTAEKNPGSLVGSVAVDARDGKTIVDGGARVSWTSAKYTWPNRGANLASLSDEQRGALSVDVLSGRGTLVPVGVFREIGMYSGSLPQYGSDYEFSRRASLAGHRLLVDYRAIVRSHVDATGIRAETATSGLRGLTELFTSRRSASSLKYRWRFARLVVPGPRSTLFYLADTARVVFSALRTTILSRRSPEC